MAKDPAVLWYYRDYLEGTELMSWPEQGAYARLLNKQADKGHLSIELIKKILKKDFEKLWPGIASKFLIDEDGNFYNDRMNIESTKRKKHSTHQREKAEERWRKERQCTGNAHADAAAYPKAMPLANANAGDVLKTDEGVKKMPPIGIELVAKVAGEVIQNQRWVDNTCMGQQINPEALKKWMAQFNTSICNDTMPDFDQSKYQKLFGGWLNRQKAKGYSLQSAPIGNTNAAPLKSI